jgi:ectoine hydroxylase-related dioxygenase (phytanoyl-CoA dioxygenase family)
MNGLAIRLQHGAIMSATNREKLTRQGFCIVSDVFDQSMIEKIKRWCVEALGNVSEDHRRQFKAQGSLIDISEHPVFSEVVAHEALAKLFDETGLSGHVFSSGSIISKPPGSPSLFWHQDWWGWDDPLSYTERIPQVNVMIYLSSTSRGNGCLRVIPGSHHRMHPIHEIPVVYGSALSRVDEPEHPIYQSWEEECAVAVRPGDVVIKDTRLLHSTYSNTSSDERTLLSLNFNPGFASLPVNIRARIKKIFLRQSDSVDGLSVPDGLHMAMWPDQLRKKVEHLFPHCADDVVPQRYNFSPKREMFEQARQEEVAPV